MALTQPARDGIEHAGRLLRAARAACVVTANLGLHDCIVHRKNVERGFDGHLPMANEAEYHRLHIALGESACATCPICFTRSKAGLPETRLSASEKQTMVAWWEAKLVEVTRTLRMDHV